MLKQLTFIILLVTSICATTAAAAEFPPPLQKCHMNDEPCIVRQANAFISAYPQGLPEMGVPALEPFRLERIEILGDKNSPSRFDLILTDVEMHKYSHMNVTNFKFPKKLPTADKPWKIVIKANADEFIFKSKYKADGQILVLPIRGEGDLEWQMKGITGVTTVIFKAEQRDDGKHYLRVADYKIDMKLKRVHTHMTNLFNGDKLLSENLLKVINDNWQLISDDVMKTVNAAFAKAHTGHLNAFLKNIPVEEFFLPDGNAL